MKILVLIFLSTFSFVYPLAYDSAIYQAQKGNWQDAHNALNSIITDNPDRADVIYDAGVAAYNLGNKCQAATYFTRAAECSTDKNIAFCAHFNAGNLYVDEKKLERALEEYDKALAIEPDNEYARYNRDRVKQMLEEQEKQQDEQQQDKDQEKDQEKDDQNQDDKQDQNQQQNGNDKKDGQQNQQGDDQQSNNGSDKHKQNDSSESKSENGNKSDQQTQDDGEQQTGAAEQRGEHRNDKKDKHQNSANDQKRDGNQQLEKQPQNAQKEGTEQQGDKHGTTPEQQNVSEHNQINGSPEEGQEQPITDPWLLNILNNQEMHDKAVNKQLMEAKIRQQGGKNGQNCW